MKKLIDLLNTKYPIIQGGMANIATAELAASVSNAGGLGLIGSGNNDREWVLNEINKMRKLTNKPFGVNILLMSPHAEDIAKLVIDEKIKIITTGAGSPSKYMKMWKDAGIIVIPVIASTYHAKRVLSLGVDALIAEGMEAGGHIGDLTTFTLIPQIVDVVDIPVIAAGGIGDSRGFNAALNLGAQGVQIGTVLLATKECPVHENYKKLVLDASGSDTVITARGTKHQARVLKNELTFNYFEMIKQNKSEEEIEKLLKGSLNKAVFDGDIKEGSFMAGQVSGLVKEIKTVKEVLDEMAKDWIKKDEKNN